MAEDYYKTLGVNRTASAEEIHKAYRDLARKYHPDLNPDDASAKKKFQTIQQAYEVLKDPKKREMFDQFGSAAFDSSGGAPRGPWRTQGGGGPAGGPGGFEGYENIDLGDILGEHFAGGGGGGGFSDIFRQFTRRPNRKGNSGGSTGGGANAHRGANVDHELTIPLRTAVMGGTAQLTVRRRSGRVETIDVKIPVGIEDGKKIRLRGMGEPGASGSPAGDILITIHVAPHPSFQRQGRDLIVRVPINLGQALRGAKVDVPTPKGTIAVTIPAGTSSGKRLRIKGHGVPSSDTPGDLYVEIMIVLPDQWDADTLKKLQELPLDQPPLPSSQLIW